MTRTDKIMRERRSFGLVAFPSATLLVFSCAIDVAAQGVAGQEVCVGNPTGSDVFSVGDVRTSILDPADFVELNGSEWVLMDGRPLAVQTALSPHLSDTDERGQLLIPDARGRFLRMLNNNACSTLQADAKAYGSCLDRRDPDGDRLPGSYQADALRGHDHEYNDIYWSETNGVVDIMGDGRSNNDGNMHDDDRNNNGFGWDRHTDFTGDKETRPKNVGVNHFVKICLCRSAACR